MAYDIIKGSDYPNKPQWGREHYARDAMNWLVPVLFEPYFDWKFCGKRVLGGLYKGQLIDTPCSVIWGGLCMVWTDLPRIIRRQWWHDEE